jgi:hypothetical protein
MIASERPKPSSFDHALRWWVCSHSTPGKEYLVQLDSYGFNGECQCKDFAIRLEPLLSRGITPAEALAGELVTAREDRRPEDALRCHHIVDAYMQFAEEVAQTIALNDTRTNETKK